MFVSKIKTFKKIKSIFERPFYGDNGQFTCQECKKGSNYRENLPKGTYKSVQIIEIFKLQRFELRKGNYKSFLRNFHGDFKFVRIMEIFEFRRFEFERVNSFYIIHKTIIFVSLDPVVFYFNLRLTYCIYVRLFSVLLTSVTVN